MSPTGQQHGPPVGEAPASVRRTGPAPTESRPKRYRPPVAPHSNRTIQRTDVNPPPDPRSPRPIDWPHKHAARTAGACQARSTFSWCTKSNPSSSRQRKQPESIPFCSWGQRRIAQFWVSWERIHRFWGNFEILGALEGIRVSEFVGFGVWIDWSSVGWVFGKRTPPSQEVCSSIAKERRVWKSRFSWVKLIRLRPAREWSCCERWLSILEDGVWVWMQPARTKSPRVWSFALFCATLASPPASPSPSWSFLFRPL